MDIVLEYVITFKIQQSSLCIAIIYFMIEKGRGEFMTKQLISTKHTTIRIRKKTDATNLLLKFGGHDFPWLELLRFIFSFVSFLCTSFLCM